MIRSSPMAGRRIPCRSKISLSVAALGRRCEFAVNKGSIDIWYVGSESSKQNSAYASETTFTVTPTEKI